MSRTLYEEWWEIERTLAPATDREKHANAGGATDWDVVEQSVLGAAVAIGCRLLETLGIDRHYSDHCNALFIARNAYLHNYDYVSQNLRATDQSVLEEYISSAGYEGLNEINENGDPLNYLRRAPLSINNGIIRYDGSILLFIRLIIIRG